MNQAPRAPDIRHRALSSSDLDSIVALHRQSIDAVGRSDLIKPETPDFFERILGGGGRITGVWLEGAFVAYGVLQIDLPPSEDARPAFGLSAGDRLAKLAGACVLPHVWGVGIHDTLIAARIEQARQDAIPHLYASAAPGNTRSWENLMQAGFAVGALVAKYGGHLRYLLYRREGAPAGDAGEEGVWCASDDTERQRALLAEGRSGSAWRKRSDGGRDICYRKRA